MAKKKLRVKNSQVHPPMSLSPEQELPGSFGEVLMLDRDRRVIRPLRFYNMYVPPRDQKGHSSMMEPSLQEANIIFDQASENLQQCHQELRSMYNSHRNFVQASEPIKLDDYEMPDSYGEDAAEPLPVVLQELGHGHSSAIWDDLSDQEAAQLYR